MYEEGSGFYKYHLQHYGPQSKVGFKDIDNMWKDDHWDPDALMTLYKAAGARYFCALANHHDNFDTWDSKYQPWNTVNIGPHKDIIGLWESAARKQGLRFAVSVHANRAWSWFDVSHRSDKQGPYAGIPYDGCLTKADGKGTWWEGYDPADLYGPAGAARTQDAELEYEAKFFNRTMDLISRYHPDQVYFDDGMLPTKYGMALAANYYNSSAAWHSGANEAVVNIKDDTEQVRQAFVHDYERGRSAEIQPYPWQTDTCLGDWHYTRSRLDHHTYKHASEVVRMLADVVSKNGNLLLSVPVRGDGTIDSDEVGIVKEIGAWMKVNSEAIHATRPWKIYGEGPTRLAGGGMNEGGEARMGEHDFRFTTKGDTLFALAYGWPENGKYLIRCLASDQIGIKGNISSVHLLGSTEALKWERTTNGLEVVLPKAKPCEGLWTLKISGLDLAKSLPREPQRRPEDLVIKPAMGALVLDAANATVHGSPLTVESVSGAPNLGWWSKSSDWASWSVNVPTSGDYRILSRYSCPDPTTILVGSGSALSQVKLDSTGGWSSYASLIRGSVVLSKGTVEVAVKPASADTWHAINLRAVVLAPVIAEADEKQQVVLNVLSAELKGGLKLEESGGYDNIGFWRDPTDTASWQARISKPGTYTIALDYAGPDPLVAQVQVGERLVPVKAPATGDYSTYAHAECGAIAVDVPGVITIQLRPKADGTWKPINVRAVTLTLRKP
jgi:alpha-L-fucosidase